MPNPPIDSVLLVGFGGPTEPGEIRPFLENVAAGRGIPEARLREVEQHYLHVGGRSPYNDRTEDQRAALERVLPGAGHALPVSVGMRNWHPYLRDTLGRMHDEGRRHAAGVILAVHRAEASHQRYLDDVAGATRDRGGATPSVSWVRPWHAHPGFLEAAAARIEEGAGHRRGGWPPDVPVILTAHSIPERMPGAAGYVEEFRASCAGVASLLELPDWEMAYQSRSGDPRTPWLGPDILDVLRRRAAAGTREVVVQAIGFLTDHVEVLYDLDVEARALCDELGMRLHRAPCVNDHPAFIAALAERVREAVREAES